MMNLPKSMMQDSITPTMEQLMFFHDHIMLILMMIMTVVSYMMIIVMINKKTNKNLLDGQMIELIWTVTPTMTLFFIAAPSLRLLYLMDEINSPMMTMKIIGNQWYWTYEYSDFKETEFNSYMDAYKKQSLRLLDSDSRMTLPMNVFTRMMVSSADVIHSWTLPSTGIKIDGTPGRLNQASMMINRTGIIYGQCSEICGTNHSFMPIVVETVPINEFMKWMMK
uniref:cytochrome c oxidase subunit II n=1 Tax=Pulchriphyllium giganteum TaxID=591861 RepID=UPI0025AA247A|nr:cytochrome c oxidase subunit II [Pulchriphyllium giganteum]WID87109.1 cytochrome c oxidase subunit II [Pulchriphyllium giganteum]